MQQRNAMTSATSGLRGKVHLADLNLEWFEDRDLADDLGADCLKLFEATEDKFESVRNQRWYKRLWSTLTGGNTRQLAAGCESLAQAQQLLLQVLQVHAQTNAQSNALMLVVAKGLRHVEHQQNQVVRAIVGMADRIELLEQEVALHRRQLNSDPSNELTWNQEHRLLLWKVMVLAAFADGEVDHHEDALLEHKLGQLTLSGPYLEEAHEFRSTPGPIGEDLERVDSYQMRLTMFRHALGVMYADGKLESSERALAERLSATLHIRDRDETRIREAFSGIHAEPDLERLEDLIGGGKKRRAPAPDSEEYAVIDSRRAELREAERLRADGIAEVCSALREVGPAWAEAVSAKLGYAVVLPILQAFEAYGELPEDSSVSDLVGTLDPETILAAVNEGLPKVGRALEAYVSDLERGFAFSQALGERFHGTWDEVINDDGGWESTLAELGAAGADLLDSQPSGIGQMVKGGALGYAGAALLGPVGWLGAAAALYFDGESKDKNLRRAANRWDSAVRRFGESTDRWGERAAKHMESFLLSVVAEVEQFVSEADTPDAAALPVQQMIVDLEGDESQAAGSLPAGENANDCPSCGRHYTSDDAWCPVCEVAL
ncbi:MAG: hypothetical protein KF901_01345 [Myxococcales bacterium]|nr:hypothetical protein [Myxococcales bacterium]